MGNRDFMVMDSSEKPAGKLAFLSPDTNEIIQCSVLREIPGGAEGRKAIVELTFPDGKMERLFMKEAIYHSDVREQKEKHRFLQSRGGSVPPEFRSYKTTSGKEYMFMSDLTEGGKRLVVSDNDVGSRDPTFMRASFSMPPETRQKLEQELIALADGAAHADETSDAIYELWGHPYVLAIDLHNPANSDIFVADFGRDVEKMKPSEHEVVRYRNLLEAGCFYARMTGKVFQLPNTHPLAAELNEKLRERAKEAIEHRGFDQLEKLQSFTEQNL